KRLGGADSKTYVASACAALASPAIIGRKNMKYFLPVRASDTSSATLSNVAIWQEAGMRGTLPWYRQVSDNLMPAKFRVARCVPVEISLAEASEEVLWQELEKRTSEFLSLWQEIRDGERDLPEELGWAIALATATKSQTSLLVPGHD